MYGLEFIYQGQKFGEYCSSDEIYADLKPFGLPSSVCQVASVTIGTIVETILAGIPNSDRERILLNRLTYFGFSKFANIEGLVDAA